MKQCPDALPDGGVVRHMPALAFGVPVEFGHASQLLIEGGDRAVGL